MFSGNTMTEKNDIPTSIEDDLKTGKIQFEQSKHHSDLMDALNSLKNPEHLESNTILTNRQVNALALMDWASHAFDIEFFKHYVSLFPRYRISGDNGRGRTEIIKIAEAIRVEKEVENRALIEAISSRR